MEDNNTIDFETIRVNCIQIHREIHEMFLVANHIGVNLELKIKHEDELRTHPDTKSIAGMGIFAKEIYDNTELWQKLPKQLWVQLYSGKKLWDKEKAKAEFLDCFYHLGGNRVYHQNEK